MQENKTESMVHFFNALTNTASFLSIGAAHVKI